MWLMQNKTLEVGKLFSIAIINAKILIKLNTNRSDISMQLDKLDQGPKKEFFYFF